MNYVVHGHESQIKYVHIIMYYFVIAVITKVVLIINKPNICNSPLCYALQNRVTTYQLKHIKHIHYQNTIYSVMSFKI